MKYLRRKRKAFVNEEKLRKEFARANERFFFNKIGRVELSFEDLSKERYVAIWKGPSRQIVLDTRAQYLDNWYWNILLLHEMIHAYLDGEYVGYPADSGHGDRFKHELWRLIEAGAYDGLL